MADLLQFAPAIAAPGIQDEAARAQALDITRSFIVEAPAGSGKTGLLIQRLLTLLASESVTDPGQVLAITFTRKATHEMRDRVLEQLAAAHRGDPPANDFDRATRPLAEAALARDRRLGWALLDHPARLNISTIDSFCAQVARSLPILSGAGSQAPVEDAGELYAEAARRTLAALGGDDPNLTAALETLLLHRDGNLADCEHLIAEMLGWRDQWGDLIPLAGAQLTDEYLETETLPRLERALGQGICRALTRLERLFPRDLCEQLSTLAQSMSHSPGYNGAENPLAICRNLPLHPGAASESLDHWKLLANLLITKDQKWRSGFNKNHVFFEIEKHHKAELKALVDRLSGEPMLREALCTLTTLPPVKYPQEQWHVAKALFRILSRALVELQIVFAERNECDFTEFSLLAREALRREGSLDDLAASAGFNLEHLLVDEMQDTSNSQYELIRLLTQRWDGHGQTVFLVGDPKQSIYLFRQARVARFLDTLRAERLGDLPLKALYLTANFRSQANLVSAFNDTFKLIFPKSPEAGDAEAVPYLTASAIRPRADGPDLVWHASAIPYSPDKTECAKSRKRQTQQNAAEIRHLVEQWRSRTLPANRSKPWHIAVLVRNRKHLLAVVEAFKQPGATGPIPFRAVKTEALAERQEVLDLVALTRALLHPADRTAWLALLRAPCCGLTLRDLHLLTGQDNRDWHERTLLTLIEQRGEELSEDGIARLAPFWTVMAAALAERGRLPLSQWVARTWQGFGADAFTTPEEAANIQRFFGLLDELEAAGPVTLTGLAHAIARLYAAESTHPGAVDLMTIHNAKGLEWDFVVVPQLEGSAGKASTKLLTWLEIEAGNEDDPEVAHGIIAPVQPKGSDAHALNKWMHSIDAAREASERKRLFYVACTRAREELHLFAAPGRKKDDSIHPRYDSLLDAAWPAAKPYFEHLPILDTAQQDQGTFDIAAAALSLVPQRTATLSIEPLRTIERIPLAAFPAASRPGSPSAPAAPPLIPFDRPEGSFAARAFGNTMHAFLELLAERIDAGTSIAHLLTELPKWSARIATLLRANGLAPDEIPRAATTLLRGLSQTLKDPDGQWILSPHPQASSETTLVAGEETIRLDRTFLAGSNPHDQAATHLWIVDFKTGSHGAEGREAFLSREREKYAPQLETYGKHLAPRGLPLRLALYYPMLPSLLWWTP